MPGNLTSYRFGPFELRIRTRELYKDGRKLKLRAQPLRVLMALVERRGDLLTREEVRDLLWAKETFVDFEHGLNTAISELRAALNDTASDPRYIETLPKLGYRIKVPVEVEEHGLNAGGTPTATSVAEVEGADEVGEANGNAERAWGWVAAVGILAALIGATVGYHGWSQGHAAVRQEKGKLMLAVLPFENLTGDAGQEYFSDGLTEEMIAQMGRLDPEKLGVIARTSVMRYKKDHSQLEAVGRELGVQYVLEGSVRRDSHQVRISAQLVQTKDQTQVWARQYDRELDNLLSLQDEIAKEIAEEIRVAIGEPKRGGAAPKARLAGTSYEAYDLYLRGMYFGNKRTLEGFAKAVDAFRAAIEKDPNFAPAYAGLADSYVLLNGYGGVLPRELMPKAREAARRAVELDGTLAESHTAMAVVAQDYDWDWKTAEKEYRKAIELDPNYATAHHWYAEYLAVMGRFEEAEAEIKQARQLDPLSLIVATDHAVILYYARQYDRAIEEFRKVREMDPHFPRTDMIYHVYLKKGMLQEVMTDLGTEKGSKNESPWYWAELAYREGQVGQTAEARSAMKELREMNRRKQIDPLAMAIACLGLNERSEAMDWLEKSYAGHSMSVISVKVDPLFDPLRGELRFKNILRGMGNAE
jgi:TolB-like protein/DNA-binding winged helix-turn-helix (wHTH) protein